jgi:hypothetical protein
MKDPQPDAFRVISPHPLYGHPLVDQEEGWVASLSWAIPLARTLSYCRRSNLKGPKAA